MFFRSDSHFQLRGCSLHKLWFQFQFILQLGVADKLLSGCAPHPFSWPSSRQKATGLPCNFPEHSKSWHPFALTWVPSSPTLHWRKTFVKKKETFLKGIVAILECNWIGSVDRHGWQPLLMLATPAELEADCFHPESLLPSLTWWALCLHSSIAASPPRWSSGSATSVSFIISKWKNLPGKQFRMASQIPRCWWFSVIQNFSELSTRTITREMTLR